MVERKNQRLEPDRSLKPCLHGLSRMLFNETRQYVMVERKNQRLEIDIKTMSSWFK